MTPSTLETCSGNETVLEKEEQHVWKGVVWVKPGAKRRMRLIPSGRKTSTKHTQLLVSSPFSVPLNQPNLNALGVSLFEWTVMNSSWIVRIRGSPVLRFNLSLNSCKLTCIMWNWRSDERLRNSSRSANHIPTFTGPCAFYTGTSVSRSR